MKSIDSEAQKKVKTGQSLGVGKIKAIAAFFSRQKTKRLITNFSR